MIRADLWGGLSPHSLAKICRRFEALASERPAFLLAARPEALHKAISVPRLLPAALWLALVGVAAGQSVSMPQTVTVAPYRLATVEMTYDGDDFAYSVAPELDAFREYTTDPNVVQLRVQFVPRPGGPQSGTFTITAVAAKAVDGVGKLSKFQTCLVNVAGPAPPPPGPDPPPVPPPPNPIVVGPREVVIIRETADSTPAQARLITALRTGMFDTYLHEKGHRMYVLDDDSVGSDGKPSPAVEAWKPIVAGIPMPAMVIVDQKTRTVLAKLTLPDSADAVLELLKQHGG